MYEFLPAAGQVILKYKVDGGSQTTIFTETTDSAVITETQNAAGTEFTEGREYEFEIDSTGGAEVTGFYARYEIKDTLV